MTQLYIKTAYAVLISSIAASACVFASAQTSVSDFPTDFDGWQQQWHKESDTGTDGVATHTKVRGFNDGASLKFDMGDGFGDDGTLWIEKQFAVAAGVPTNIALSLQLFNEFQSDFNNFQVKAAISNDDSQVQADFDTIGSTGSAEGWVPFSYQETITSSTGQVWVAFGIRVAFETHRDYLIDHVTVTTEVIPEPACATLLVNGFLTLAWRVRRKRNISN